MSSIYLLNNMKFKGIKNIPLFDIEYIKSDIDLKKYDALIFTSKNAIMAIDSFNKDWKDIPAYTIAPKTAKVIGELGGNLLFTSNSSNGDDFANNLITHIKGKKVLYIRALKVVSRLVDILENNQIDIDEVITYKTSCTNINYEKPEKNSTIIFTSPSCINCFFQKFSWDETYNAIAIGHTTASFFPKNIKNIYISESLNVESCIKLARTI